MNIQVIGGFTRIELAVIGGEALQDGNASRATSDDRDGGR